MISESLLSDSLITDLEQKFGVKFRDVQRQLLLTLLSSDVDVNIVNAPTGTGKSLVGLAYAYEYYRSGYARRIYILTPTIFLQQQYMRDFHRFKLGQLFGRARLMYGRGNFTCDAFPHLEAAVCPALFAGYRCRYAPERKITPGKDTFDVYTGSGTWLHYDTPNPEDHCSYWHAKMEAIDSNLVIMNYDYFLVDAFGPMDFFVPDVLVLDEGHAIFDRLMGRFSLIIPKRELDVPYFLSYDFRGSIDISVFSRALADFVHRQLDALMEKYRARSLDKRELTRLYRYFFYSTVVDVIVRYPYAFRVINTSRAIRVIPEPTKLLSALFGYLYSRRPGMKVLIMSGTVGPSALWRTVVPRSLRWQYYSIEESPFPVERRYVYFPLDVPVLSRERVLSDDRIARWMVSVIYAGYLLLRRHNIPPSVLVHAYLVDFANLVYAYFQEYLSDAGLDPSIVSKATGTGSTKVVQSWVEKGGILVTTAANEGVDLPYDACRLQFILKAPYPNVVAYPKHLLNFYVARTVVQQAGRIVRSKDDWGYTIVLDRKVYEHLTRVPAYYPKYFKQAVRSGLTLAKVFEEIDSLIRRWQGG